MAYNRRRLPFIEPNLIAGKITKWSKESTAGVGLREAINVDAFDEYGGLSQIHGSTRRSGLTKDEILTTLSGTISRFDSINYFEGFDLDGQLQRRVVTLASGTGLMSSGTLFFVNDDKSLTQLTGTENYIHTPEPLHGVTMLDRAHFTSENNFPFKVSVQGTVSKWGLDPPGAASTTIHNMAPPSGINPPGTVVGGDGTFTLVTPPDEPDATGSTIITRDTDLGLTTATVDDADYWPGDLEERSGGFIHTYIFVPAGDLSNYRQIGSAINLKHIGVTGTERVFDYSVGELNEGWNVLTADLNNPDVMTTGVRPYDFNKNELALVINWEPPDVSTITPPTSSAGSPIADPGPAQRGEYSVRITPGVGGLRAGLYGIVSPQVRDIFPFPEFTIGMWVKFEKPFTGYHQFSQEPYFTLTEVEDVGGSNDTLTWSHHTDGVSFFYANMLSEDAGFPDRNNQATWTTETEFNTKLYNKWVFVCLQFRGYVVGSAPIEQFDLFFNGERQLRTSVPNTESTAFNGTGTDFFVIGYDDSVDTGFEDATFLVYTHAMWSGRLRTEEMREIARNPTEDYRRNFGKYESAANLGHWWRIRVPGAQVTVDGSADPDICTDWGFGPNPFGLSSLPASNDLDGVLVQETPTPAEV